MFLAVLPCHPARVSKGPYCYRSDMLNLERRCYPPTSRIVLLSTESVPVIEVVCIRNENWTSRKAKLSAKPQIVSTRDMLPRALSYCHFVMQCRISTKESRDHEMLAIGGKSGESPVAVFELPVQHGHHVVCNSVLRSHKEPT